MSVSFPSLSSSDVSALFGGSTSNSADNLLSTLDSALAANSPADPVLSLFAPPGADSGSTDSGDLALFGPATTIDPATSALLDTLSQADSNADNAFDASVPNDPAPTSNAAGSLVNLLA